MSFTLCTLNANGLRSAERKGFGDWIESRKPDFLLLQELRAWPDQLKPHERCPPGYNTRLVCAQKKGYSGVGIWSRPPADHYVVGSGLPWGDAEGRVLRADFGELTLVSAYLPSGSSGEERQGKKNEYLEHFRGYLDELLAEGRPTAVCGDLNIAHDVLDIHAPKRNEKNSGFLPHERAWMTSVLESGWVDVQRKLHPGEAGLYSWWSNRGRAREKDLGWRIDYTLCSPQLAELASEAWIEKDAGLSDHAPCFVRFDWPEDESQPAGKGTRF